MIDWDKEDDEVCAVLKYYYSEDTLLKIVDGELFRKDRGNSGWTTTGETLDYYRENFSSLIHIRPSEDVDLIKWDWRKEDSDVIGIIKVGQCRDTLIKVVKGVLYLKSRRENGWNKVPFSLDEIKLQFDNNELHFRPKVDWNLAPKGAIKLVEDDNDFFWINSENQWWDYNDNTWNTDNYCADNIIVSTREDQKELEWTIYNNGLPFSELTSEQKGELMVASLDHNMKFGYSLEIMLSIENTPNWVSDVIYQAIKSQPDMIELFNNDLESIPKNCAYAPHMIEKGWYKRDIEGEEL